MIDEYDMRASLWPISTAIDSSAPAITEAVIGSTRVVRRSAHRLRIRLPEASARAVQPGGTTVVVSRWKTTAAPSNASPTGSSDRS